MSDDTAPADRTVGWPTMRAILRGYWQQARPCQRFLYLSGFFLIAVGLFHVGVYAVQGGEWSEPVSWRKPIIFGFSTGFTCIAIAWVLTFLPWRRWPWRCITYGMALAFLLEAFLVTMQQWRGVPSHFNFATSFDSAVFAIMGQAIVLVEIIVLVTTVWTLVSLRASDSIRWAIWIGMVLLAVSQVFGNLIVANGVPKMDDLEAAEFLAGGARSAYIVGEAGSLKVPHALTLHGIQVLPLLAFLLLFSAWRERRRTAAVLLAGMGYSGIVIVSALQAFRGLAMFDMGALLSSAFWLSLLCVVVAYTSALVAIWLAQNQSPTVSATGQNGMKS